MLFNILSRTRDLFVAIYFIFPLLCSSVVAIYRTSALSGLRVLLFIVLLQPRDRKRLVCCTVMSPCTSGAVRATFCRDTSRPESISDLSCRMVCCISGMCVVNAISDCDNLSHSVSRFLAAAIMRLWARFVWSWHISVASKRAASLCEQRRLNSSHL